MCLLGCGEGCCIDDGREVGLCFGNGFQIVEDCNGVWWLMGRVGCRCMYEEVCRGFGCVPGENGG